MKTIKLLFIDDDLQEARNDGEGPNSPMFYYLRALQKHDDAARIELRIARSVDEAKRVLASSIKFDVVSIDIMMPAGELLKGKDTGNDTRTGIEFLKWMIAQQFKTSVIVLSNIPDSMMRPLVPPNSGRLKTIVVAEKKRMLPYEFVELVLQLGDAR